MKRGRRTFLQNGLMSGFAAAVAPRMRVEIIGTRERPGSSPEVPAFELEETTIAELQEEMKAGKYTARGITEKYLARIEALDKHAPPLHSVTGRNPHALALAAG